MEVREENPLACTVLVILAALMLFLLIELVARSFMAGPTL
jgi:hypothetical protein